jgi:hypothetical protein
VPHFFNGLFSAVEPGATLILPMMSDTAINHWTALSRMVRKARYVVWPRLYHAMRASRVSDWCALVPGRTAAAWAGHSPLISAPYYLTHRDKHFRQMTDVGQECPQPGAGSGALCTDLRRTEWHGAPVPRTPDAENRGKTLGVTQGNS